MPKTYDIKRNYYADLELPPNASIDDIKKQYRKLAKIWHPDRNAGKEEECVPRFQAIQAAHEILSDPVQKAQYDADRRVAGPFASSSTTTGPAPRGHPYQATSNFPPPPRRTAPNAYSRPPPRPQTNGAERFTNFANNAPPQTKRTDPAQDKQNVFTAWQNMKNKERQQAAGSASGTSTPGQTPRRPQPPPRADTKYPTEADAAGARRPDFEGWSQPTGAGVHRSNTGRTPKKQGFDPNAPGSDERPASGHYSHRHKSEDFGQPANRTDAKSMDGPTSSPRRPHIDPTNPNRRADADNVPFAEGNRRRTPYTSFIGERTDFATDIRRSKSTRDTTKLAPDGTRAQSTSPLSPPRFRGAAFETPNDESDVGSSAEPSPGTDETPFTKPPNVAQPAERPKKVPSPPSRHYQEGRSPLKDNIFAYVPPHLPTGKSRSEEYINTKFANGSDFTGTFASQQTATPPQSRSNSRKSTMNRQNSRGRSTTHTFGQPSPLGTKATTTDLPPPPTSAPKSTTPVGGFSPEEWAQHFADGSWVAPPPPPRERTTADDTGISPTTDSKARDSGFSAGDSDRMDIDDEPPSRAQNDNASMPPPPRPPRLVQVPPTQWQKERTQHSTDRFEEAEQPELQTNLDDLSHVEPLGRAEAAGLKNMVDLSADLPFKSKASQSVPFTSVKPQIPTMSSVPAPPSVPAKITKQSWTHYAADFGRYLGAFHNFNSQFLTHFAARQAAAEAKISDGMDWLKASGDVVAGNGLSGFAAYHKATEEDASLREIWQIGCERHRSAVSAFDDFRETVRQLASAGGLVDR